MRSPHAPHFHDRRQDLVGWLVISLVSGLTFVGLATAGRPPGVDLPQHVLFLQRMLDGSNEVYEVSWAVPYALLFAIAMPIAKLTDAAIGIWAAAAFAIALLPVGAAAVAHSLRRSPALGVFAYLTAFSTVVAWGFASLVLSAGLFGLAAAAAIRYCRKPDLTRGLLLALLMVATYSAHTVGWFITLGACWLILVIWPRRFRLVNLWPALLGTAVSVAIMNAWLIGRVHPWADGVPAVLHKGENHDLLWRVLHLPLAVAEYGRAGASLGLWLPLALLLALGSALSLRDFIRARARVRRLGPRVATLPWIDRCRRFLKRHGMPLAWVASVIAYFVVPLWAGTILMVYPRVLMFSGILTPALFLGRRRRSAHVLALVAVIPAGLMIHNEVLETRLFAKRTQCVDTLAREMRHGESLLQLYYRAIYPDYTVPVDVHLVAEMAARRHAMIGKDFTDYGAGPVAYRPGYDRLIVPANLIWNPRFYDHARHGREFTAWLLVGSPRDPRELLRATFGKAKGLHATNCGRWTLVVDRSVAPGSRKHEKFMPHRHPGGSCSLAAHGEVLFPEAQR